MFFTSHADVFYYYADKLSSCDNSFILRELQNI